MEGDKYHNRHNASAVDDDGKPTPSNITPVDTPSTEAAGDPKPQYMSLDVGVRGGGYLKIPRGSTLQWGSVRKIITP